MFASASELPVVLPRGRPRAGTREGRGRACSRSPGCSTAGKGGPGSRWGPGDRGVGFFAGAARLRRANERWACDVSNFAPNETKGESWGLGWGAPEGMLAQSSCASRFGRRLLFLSMFFPDVHLAGWLLSVTVLITASAALIGVRAGGHLARPFRVIRLLVVAVVALDGERPAIRSLPDDYSIVAQHRVVSARASRRPLRVCAGGLFRSGLVSFGKRLAPPRLTKARSRRSRLDVSAFSSGAAQAAVSPIGLTIGSVLGKDTGARVRFMRTGCLWRVPSWHPPRTARSDWRSRPSLTSNPPFLNGHSVRRG